MRPDADLRADLDERGWCLIRVAQSLVSWKCPQQQSRDPSVRPLADVWTLALAYFHPLSLSHTQRNQTSCLGSVFLLLRKAQIAKAASAVSAERCSFQHLGLVTRSHGSACLRRARKKQTLPYSPTLQLPPSFHCCYFRSVLSTSVNFRRRLSSKSPDAFYQGSGFRREQPRTRFSYAVPSTN